MQTYIPAVVRGGEMAVGIKTRITRLVRSILNQPLIAFYVNRFSVLYAGTGAVNALIIDEFLNILTYNLLMPKLLSTFVAVVTSIVTDFTWKSEVVFRTPLLSWERFYKYFLNGSAATIIQYVLTNLLSYIGIPLYIAYIFAVAIGFLFAYTISRLKIWKQYVPQHRHHP